VPDRKRSGRLVHRLVVAWFVLVFLAMIWPLYVPMARVRPLVLGVPFSLAWIAGLLIASFFVLLGYHLHQGRARRRGGEGDA
jgi:hypothetical protein